MMVPPVISGSYERPFVSGKISGLGIEIDVARTFLF
jgi:hypothetical protein